MQQGTKLFDLTGRRALVTGSSQGIGFALARGLAAAGAAIVLNGRNPEKLAEASAALREQGCDVAELPFDATDHEAVRSAVDGFEIVRAWGSAVLTVEGHTMQLLNAHLASGNGAALSGLRTLQAVELMTHARTDMPVVLTGDLNDVPDSGMHSTITGAGFADVWATLVPWSSGETCCHADDLSNPRAELSTRIDYVMARGFAHGNRAVRGAILRLGLWSFEKVEGPFFPIWPSDHAGLWARLTLP